MSFIERRKGREGFWEEVREKEKDVCLTHTREKKKKKKRTNDDM